MLSDVRTGIRGGVAFILATLALIPVSFASLVVGMSSASPVVAAVTFPLVFSAQWAFPRSLVGGQPYRSLPVPTVLIFAAWIVLAVGFGLIVSRFRTPRLWFAAPIAVACCVLVSNLAYYFCGFEVALDGP